VNWQFPARRFDGWGSSWPVPALSRARRGAVERVQFGASLRCEVG
jgi:hypothetical protein